MLREYAVEPDLVPTWLDRETGRYFLDNFGLGTPRIMSRYPRKHWKRLVWAAWRASNDGKENEQTRMETLVQRLSEVMVKRRNAVWDPSRPWLDSAVEEHMRAPFHAVLARSNPAGHDRILIAGDVDGRTPLWAVDHGDTIPRKAEAIAGAVGDMLRVATDIVFVDPHFAPHRRRFFDVLDACFGKCFEGRVADVPRIRLFSSTRDENGEFEFFKKECRNRLPVTLPDGQEATIRRLRERRPVGEKLHNRYILTELGGVSFGTGLDREEALGHATDDLNLLGRDQYERRWRQYASEPPAFDQPEAPIVVTGTGRIS